MSIHKRKFFAALAVAGVVAAGGSAFTGGGIGSNPADQFVGGNVAQNVVGTTVTGVAYDTDEAANTITSVTLTFGNELVDGKTPTLDFTGTGDQPYTCAAVAVGVGLNTSVCTPTGTAAANTVSSTTITVA
jgi:hypothetical protein